MFEMKKRNSKRGFGEDIIYQNYNSSNSFRKNGIKTQMMKNFPIKTLNYYI